MEVILVSLLSNVFVHKAGTTQYDISKNVRGKHKVFPWLQTNVYLDMLELLLHLS